MANADQALGQNVHQEPAQELIRGDRHDLLLAAVRIIFPAKRHSIILDGNQSMVGDGDPMCITTEVVQNMVGTTEGRFGVNDPVLSEQFPKKLAKTRWLSKVLE